VICWCFTRPDKLVLNIADGRFVPGSHLNKGQRYLGIDKQTKDYIYQLPTLPAEGLV